MSITLEQIHLFHSAIRHIGPIANLWQSQFFTKSDEDTFEKLQKGLMKIITANTPMTWPDRYKANEILYSENREIGSLEDFVKEHFQYFDPFFEWETCARMIARILESEKALLEGVWAQEPYIPGKLYRCVNNKPDRFLLNKTTNMQDNELVKWFSNGSYVTFLSQVEVDGYKWLEVSHKGMVGWLCDQERILMEV